MMNDTESRFSLLEIDDVPAKPAPPPPAIVDPTPKAPAIVPAMAFPFASAPAIPTPAGMRTPQGVPMSGRMARCYGWFNARSIPLTPFSTDSCVASYANKIDAAIAEAEALPGGTPNRDDLLADLRAVRSRTPDNRAPEDHGAAPTGKAAHEELVAVGKADESTGAVVYWSLSGDLDLAKLSALWGELPKDWKPTPPSLGVALTRTAKEKQSRRTLVRPHPKGGWQFVYENAAGESLSYERGMRVYLRKDGADEVLSFVGDDGTVLDSVANETSMVSEIRARFEHHKETVAAADIGTWMVWVCRKLGAVSLRATGGVYFVPRTTVEKFHAVKAAVLGAAAHKLFEIPALKSADAVSAILEAVQAEVDAVAEELRGELEQGLTQRKARTRTENLAALAEKVASYERLLGSPMRGATDAIKKLAAEVAKSATRGAMLEVD